ncbi:MAG: LamG-like jellyroll fold domain-containing protein [Candidatus Neomarinimicrobiota bacterium]
MKFIYQAILIFIIVRHSANAQDYSINFDGNNDYVRIPDNSQLDLTGNYTLEAWIFPETFSWLAGIISKYQTNGANGYILRLTDQAPYNGLGFDELITNTGLLSNNQWHHVAAVKDEGSRRLYLNGIEQPLTGSPLNVVANNNSIRIGSDYGSRYFDGRIDEVRIWNISRPENEIIANMDTVLSGQENGLVAYYNFNEGIGDTLLDRTGNGHHGIIMGSPSWVDGYTLSALLGDINFDEELNIYDAVMLVAIMLNHEQGSELQLNSCDVNQDDVIDIEDIVLLFQWILDDGTNYRRQIINGEYHILDKKIIISSDGDIAGFQITLLDQYMDIDLTLPLGWSHKRYGEKLVAYSFDGAPLPEDFSFFIDNPNLIENIKLAGWHRTAVKAKMVYLPNSFKLKNTPNPFNPGCNISFRVNKNARLMISLYDIKGQFVHTIKNEQFSTGEYDFYWEPFGISSGTYFLKIDDGENTQHKKIIFLK